MQQEKNFCSVFNVLKSLKAFNLNKLNKNFKKFNLLMSELHYFQ